MQLTTNLFDALAAANAPIVGIALLVAIALADAIVRTPPEPSRQPRDAPTGPDRAPAGR